MQDVSAPGGEVKNQKSKALNPLPTNETSTFFWLGLKPLLCKGLKMCKLRVEVSRSYKVPCRHPFLVESG
ncbi:hypothetical protein BC008_00090 [Mastigocoleus testarum BC008]|uniref:Uncharacterized protein n=1 Tax=Mastigocoleus testarum BC008 TaxID=371196 RepID=A0A0V7ZUN5_9CYAN|nr:hypothetical protein BC008_00090 [Mastigocoleus testarum BC008]